MNLKCLLRFFLISLGRGQAEILFRFNSFHTKFSLNNGVYSKNNENVTCLRFLLKKIVTYGNKILIF
jgi:hypothetical protein